MNSDSRRWKSAFSGKSSYRAVLLKSRGAWEELFRQKPRAILSLPLDAKWDEKPKAICIQTEGATYIWKSDLPLAESVPGEFINRINDAGGFRTKILAHQFLNLGLKVSQPTDVELMAWLLNPEGIRDLRSLSQRYLNFPLGSFQPEDVDSLIAYTDALSKLTPILVEAVKNAGLWRVWDEIERPLTPILVEMERAGIEINAEYLQKIGEEIKSRMGRLENEIHMQLGAPINIASPQQLRDALYKNLNLPAKGIRRTPGGALSVDSDALKNLTHLHPAVEKIISWRELQKMLTGYVKALPKLINPSTGRIHTTFIQTGTATGRLASENPNLQNIPKRGEFGIKIRGAFKARPEWNLVSFDYSQIELRIVASLSHDERMIEAFRRGEDIHAAIASAILQKPIEKVTAEERFRAKALNFGIIYGMGPKSFAETAGLTAPQAQNFIQEYFRDFEGVKQYLENLKALAKERGWTETPTGRKRFVPEIVSFVPRIRAQAERIALNSPIQGFAADLIKLAMIRVSNMLEEKNWQDSAKLLLTVHDELLFEIRRGIMEDATPAIRDTMTSVWEDTSVPIAVEVRTGNNWGEL